MIIAKTKKKVLRIKKKIKHEIVIWEARRMKDYRNIV